MENIIIQHWFHEHPLNRVDATGTSVDRRWDNWCYGCRRFFIGGEAVYGCCSDNCLFRRALHQECAEMAREIRHPAHPSHTLKQVDNYLQSGCAVCEEPCRGFIYICSRGCEWRIHLGCAGDADLDIEMMSESSSRVMLKHASHPQHELQFLKGEKKSCSLQCDACGTMEKGNSYLCTTCNYWIHESCANLPLTQDFPRHHPGHSLSIAFRTPYEYIQYEYECAVCGEALRLRHWVYHCRLCRYVAHIKCCCATNKIDNENSIATDDDKDIIKFPMKLNAMYEEIIRPFVKKQTIGSFLIPNDECEAEQHNNIITSTGKYKFHNHKHLLSFTKFSSHQNEEEEDDDDDDDPRLTSVITCDGCTLPIHKKYSSSRSSSSSCCESESESGYMFCGECDYFLHLACFNLPPELSSHSLHPIQDHKLILLQNSNKLKHWLKCSVCNYSTNGLFYACTKCCYFLDIKCASLPDTMKHAGHPRPHHFLKLVNAGSHTPNFCSACYAYIGTYKICYSCDSCRFSLCLECVFLPASNKHRLDKHRMPLTYNASVNHPSDFHCGSCEEKMNPRMWMYHCPHCQESFHPACFPAASGEYRNINFGSHQRYYVNLTTNYHHPHQPLKFQIITKKKHCDICRDSVYGKPGFQCADCNFVSCLEDHPNVSITPSSTHNI